MNPPVTILALPSLPHDQTPRLQTPFPPSQTEKRSILSSFAEDFNPNLLGLVSKQERICRRFEEDSSWFVVHAEIEADCEKNFLRSRIGVPFRSDSSVRALIHLFQWEKRHVIRSFFSMYLKIFY